MTTTPNMILLYVNDTAASAAFHTGPTLFRCSPAPTAD